jgi:hypothetical protein
MSAQVTISQLPAAGAITGTELVPIVQNGQTVQTTTAALAGSPAQTQTFITKNQEPTLPNSRALSGGTGIGLVDGGAQSTLQITLNGVSGSLETASNGIIAKSSGSVVARTLSTSGSGLSVTDGNGVSGNPTFQLTGVAASVAGLSGTGMLAMTGGGTTVSGRDLLGTANQITVTDGNGASGNPTFAIASNATFPGTGGITIPNGSTAQQPAGTNGQFRFNTDTQTFDGFSAGSWRQFSVAGGLSSFSAGSTGFTPSSPTSGNVVLGGTLNVDSGGSGANTLTGYLVGNGTSPFTAVATIPNSGLTNSSITIGSTTVSLGDTITTFAGTSISGATNTLSNIDNSSLTNSAITINGSSVSLGGSVTVTATASNALTIGTGLSGTSYNGSAAVTIAIDSTVATLTGTQTLTNKTLTSPTINTPTISTPALTGGTINNAIIGGVTPAAGTFTSVAMTTGTITTAPTTGTDIVNKDYADAIASGINFHQSCRLATTTALAANTYNNGTSGVGATLTANANGALSVDSVAVAVGNRILVKNEATQANNGVYTVTQTGSAGAPYILTRATDFDTAGTGVDQIDAGDFFLITAGSTLANTSWVQQTPLPITVGTTAIVFSQFGAPLTYSAGTGLTESPSYTFNIANTGVTSGSYGLAASVPTIAVNAQGQITSASNTAIAIAASQVTSGTLAIAQGGTNSSATPTAGGASYGTGTAFAFTAAGTAGQVLTSNGASAPTWSGISGGTF